MKKLKALITAALCLCAVCIMCAAPACALEYTISAPGNPEYGKPTSFEPMVTADGRAMKNEDLSKSAALIPPGFGTPTSYLSNSGIGVDSSGFPTVSGGTFSVGQTVAFTEVTGSMYYSDGSLGVLKIPSIDLTVSIYEGTDSAALAKGAGHFENTSIWAGNVAVAGHNRGVRHDFGKIHTLNSGDIITLTTVLGTRTYAVTGVTKVDVTDTSGLAATAENCITLYTCVMDQPDYRWCVTAVEIGTV